jgi:hypothetical protein
MNGRLLGFEKLALIQPSWNQSYSMTMDKANDVLSEACFDYTE